MYLFQNAFNFLKMGYASAMAWILFVLTMLITLLILRSSRRWIHYGG
jgi:multiple sugar transport system permease protein